MQDPSKPSASSSSSSSSSAKDLTFPPPASLEYDRGGLVHPIEATAVGRVVWALLGGYTQRQQLHLGGWQPAQRAAAPITHTCSQ
jgi:hypothetical protein